MNLYDIVNEGIQMGNVELLFQLWKLSIPLGNFGLLIRSMIDVRAGEASKNALLTVKEHADFRDVYQAHQDKQVNSLLDEKEYVDLGELVKHNTTASIALYRHFINESLKIEEISSLVLLVYSLLYRKARQKLYPRILDEKKFYFRQAGQGPKEQTKFNNAFLELLYKKQDKITYDYLQDLDIKYAYTNKQYKNFFS